MSIRILKVNTKIRSIQVIILILIGIFGLSKSVGAVGIWNLLGGFAIAQLFLVISWILYLPIYFFGFLVSALLIPLMLWVATYNNFLTQPGVQEGWIVVRDLANMFIVIGVLVIACGTLFKIESYSYKKLLPKLVIAAILINFSKFIMGFLIDISQVIMLTFVNAFKGMAAGNLIYAIGLDKILAMSTSFSSVVLGASGMLTLLGSMLLGIIILIVTTGILLIITVYLVARIIVLWLAIVLSPLLFVLPLFPQGQKFSSQIWGMVSKYLMTGPFLAFFLWLSFWIMQNTTAGGMSAGFDASLFSGGAQSFQAFFSKLGSIDTLLNFILAIGLLITALMLASQMGVAGSKMAGSFAGKLQAAGIGTALWAPKRVWGATKQGYNEMTTKLLEEKGKPVGVGRKILFAALNSVAAVRGWDMRSKELSEGAKKVAAAGGREVTEQFRTWKADKWYKPWARRVRVKIPYRQQVRSAAESQFTKDFIGLDRNQKAEIAAALYGAKDEDSRDRWRALIKVAGHEGHVDDILANPIFREAVRKKKGVNLSYGEYINKKGQKRFKYNYGVVNDFFAETLGDTQDGLRLLKEMEDIGKLSGHDEYGGHQRYEGGVYKMNRGKEALSAAKGEFNKTAGRSRFAKSPHDFMELGEGVVYYTDENGILQRDENGFKALGMDDFHKNNFLGTFAGDTAGHTKEHTQQRNLSYFLGGSGDVSNLDKQGYAHIDEDALGRFKYALENAPDILHAAYQKGGGKKGELKFIYHNKDGKVVEKIENEEALRKFISGELGTEVKGQVLYEQGLKNVTKTFKNGEYVSDVGTRPEEEKGGTDTEEKIIERKTQINREERELEDIKQDTSLSPEAREKKSGERRDSARQKEDEIAAYLQPAVADNMTRGLNQDGFVINPDSIRNLGDTLASAVQDALKGVETGTADFTKISDVLRDVAKQLKNEKNRIPLNNLSDNIVLGKIRATDTETQKAFLARLDKIAENLVKASFRGQEAKKKEKE